MRRVCKATLRHFALVHVDGALAARLSRDLGVGMIAWCLGFDRVRGVRFIVFVVGNRVCFGLQRGEVFGASGVGLFHKIPFEK